MQAHRQLLNAKPCWDTAVARLPGPSAVTCAWIYSSISSTTTSKIELLSSKLYPQLFAL